jgi:hypothetical protein
MDLFAPQILKRQQQPALPLVSCVIDGNDMAAAVFTGPGVSDKAVRGPVAGPSGLLMEGANELGFPAFSVLAGLGVGGLAVALAASDSLANLLGSVLLMFEKPFRVGHRIRLSGSEGVVEDVGFRSTRIRTADNSLISIPNNAVVNETVENLTLRRMFRQRLLGASHL